MKRLEELGISPAPWSFCDGAINSKTLDTVARYSVFGFQQQIVANANLLAAAPEMYDAAERVLRFHDESCIHGSRTFEEITRDYLKAMSDLRAALAKAAGESEVGNGN